MGNKGDLPQCVKGRSPRQDHDDGAAGPQEVLHGKRKTQDAGADNGSDVVERAVPPALGHETILCLVIMVPRHIQGAALFRADVIHKTPSDYHLM